MTINELLVKSVKEWDEQDTLSKCLIMVALLMVLFAYLPTLQFDYVTQDQWRAFRYSTLAQTPYDRMKACVKLIPEYYFLTGRPLVWVTECIEHTIVARISDFTYLRPIVLFIVLLTAVYLGPILAPYAGGLSMGVLSASVFLMNSGYSFMYLQSMLATMVLISIILSVASFSLLNKLIAQGSDSPKYSIKHLYAPFLLFVASCMIYPAWAFLVIALAWVAFGFDDKNSEKTKFWHLGVTLSFYLIASISYYLLTKITIALYTMWTGYTPNLGTYEVAMQLNPKALWDRLIEVIKYSYTMSPFNFEAPHGSIIAILGLFSAKVGLRIYKKDAKYSTAIAYSVFVFFFGCIVLLASISPWLFSRMDALAPRYLIPWSLFLSVTIVGLISSIFKNLPIKSKRFIPVIVLIFVLIPIAALQNKLSFLEAVVSGIEIESMRLDLERWLNLKGYVNNRFLLIVTPKRSRPAFVEQLINGKKGVGQNAVLSSSQNPVSIPWMVNALLRERADHPIGQAIAISDCSFDQNCMNSNLLTNNNVVLAITNGNSPIKTPENPFVLNLSVLTKEPILPVIERFQFPEISASSQLDSYGPQGLLFQQQPGWHASRLPKYPQLLTVDFHNAREIHILGLLPQDGLSGRAPKAIRVEKSIDGSKWITVTSINNACKPNKPDGWHDVLFNAPIKTRHLRVSILSNCGDAEFLTLRGLKIE